MGDGKIQCRLGKVNLRKLNDKFSLNTDFRAMKNHAQQLILSD